MCQFRGTNHNASLPMLDSAAPAVERLDKHSLQQGIWDPQGGRNTQQCCEGRSGILSPIWLYLGMQRFCWLLRR